MAVSRSRRGHRRKAPGDSAPTRTGAADIEGENGASARLIGRIPSGGSSAVSRTPAAQTVAEMQALLAGDGTRRISIDYDEAGEPIAQGRRQGGTRERGSARASLIIDSPRVTREVVKGGSDHGLPP